MPDLYDQGATSAFDQLGAIVTPIDGVAINYLVERTPLYSMLPRQKVGALTVKLTSDAYRPMSTVLQGGGSAIANNATTLTLSDASAFMVGDVLELASGEAVIITADPNVGANTIVVLRGYAGTAASSQADQSVAYLIGNTRTGGEILQTAISRLPKLTEQYMQTVQMPYFVAGALESATEYALPPGMASFLGRDRAYAIQHAADDIEKSSYYGFGKKLGGAADRQQMVGLRSLMATNKILSPTNGNAYQPSDFTRDVIKGPFDNGGRIDVALVSSQFMIGLQKWGLPLVKLDVNTNAVGIAPTMYKAPFLNDITLIPCPLMRQGDVFGLTSDEVFMGEKRPMFDQPRGYRGDAKEGDVIAEFGILLHNEHHHSYVTGVTGFAPES